MWIVLLLLLLGSLSLPACDSGEAPERGGLRLGPEPDPPAVDSLFAQGRFWQAARALDEYLDRARAPEPEILIAAARANVEWGGAERAAELLADRPWLDEVAGGRGWYYLGRGLDARGDVREAVEVYGRFLELGADRYPEEARAAQLRMGLAQVRAGEADEGWERVRAAAAAVDGLGRWTPLLVGEAYADRGDGEEAAALLGRYDSGAAGLHARRLRLQAARRAGDQATARALAREFRGWAGTAATRAEFLYEGASSALSMGDTAAAVAAFRSVIDTAPVSLAGLRSARRLEETSDLARDRILIADVYHDHGLTDRAIAHYEGLLEGGAGDRAARDSVRLGLADALIDDGREADAVRVLAGLLDRPGATGRQAWNLTASAHSRAGSLREGRAAYRELGRRFPERREAALFFGADLAHEAGDLDAARTAYRAVIRSFPGRDLAGLAAMRLAGLEFFEGNHARAARVWEEYRRSFARGGRWLAATYWAGRAYEEMGDAARARERYAAVRSRDRMSYYALRASERLGEPFWPVPLRARGLPSAAEREAAEGRMAVLDLLQSAGYSEAADAEAAHLISTAPGGGTARAAHAEALAERGYARWGIQMGTAMEARQGRTEQALRLQYPMPYRRIIAAEAGDRDLDPFVAAALIRQESLFEARITSPVGARGLMQVMPRTGRAVADELEIEHWDDDLLYEPEINIHIGVAYLAAQMDDFDRSLPAVFGAYNAGPHRVERWQDYPEWGRDEELFTERIPFRETRDYIKILSRNLAVYRGLYGTREEE